MAHHMIPGYVINDLLKQDNSWKLLRCTRLKDDQSVLIKHSSNQPQQPYLAQRLENEFNTLRNIDIPGVLKAYDLLVDSRSSALVLQDPGGSLMPIIRLSRSNCYRYKTVWLDVPINQIRSPTSRVTREA